MSASPAKIENVQSEVAWAVALPTLIVLALVNFFNYMDRVALSALAAPIKAEFSLSDTEIGLMTGFAFVLLYATAGLPLAQLAERRGRKRVIAAAIIVWSTMTASCALAGSYLQLLICRLGVGIGEAGSVAPSQSILSDHFSERWRTLAFSAFLIGNTLGVLAGLALGGWLGERYGWRIAIAAIGLPGFALSLAVMAFVKERPPSPSVRVDYSIRTVISDRRLWWVISANAVYASAVYGLGQWLPQFYTRSHGLDLSGAGVSYGLASGIGLTIGMLLGGLLGTYAIRKTSGSAMRLAGWALLLAVILYGIAFTITSSAWSLIFTAGATIAAAVPAPQIITASQAIAAPGTRATSAALSAAAGSLVGVGCMPVLIGALSDSLQRGFGSESLRVALLIGLVPLLGGFWICRRAAAALELPAPSLGGSLMDRIQ